MSVRPTIAEFKNAATAHLAAADAAMSHNGGLPGSASYLAHVAAECALKFRILKMHGKTRTQEMKDVLAEAYERIFRSKDGHDLGTLSQHANLQRLLQVEGKVADLTDAAWKRLMNTDRPYSLRYATEKTSVKNARADLDFVESLSSVLLRDA